MSATPSPASASGCGLVPPAGPSCASPTCNSAISPSTPSAGASSPPTSHPCARSRFQTGRLRRQGKVVGWECGDKGLRPFGSGKGRCCVAAQPLPPPRSRREVRHALAVTLAGSATSRRRLTSMERLVPRGLAGEVPEPGADQQERGVAVGERADDARATPDLAHDAFERVVRAPRAPVLARLPVAATLRREKQLSNPGLRAGPPSRSVPSAQDCQPPPKSSHPPPPQTTTPPGPVLGSSQVTLGAFFGLSAAATRATSRTASSRTA